MYAEEYTILKENIVYFNEPLALNIFGAYSITNFTQEQSAQYEAEKPWTLGLGIRYKDISLKFSMPSFYAFTDDPFNTFDLQINSYYDAIYYEAFCKRFHGYYDANDDATKVNIDLDLFSTGISFGWIQNNKDHSLRAVYNLDGKQLKSNGSFIFGFGVFYISIHNSDENILRYYVDKQHFLYFGPVFGYSYTFVFPHNMFLNINATISGDAGININENNWLFIPQLMPKIAFGYHGNSWSVNFIGSCNDIIILRDKNSFDNILSATMTIMFSKRLALNIKRR
jgi:hypothetical protein